MVLHLKNDECSCVRNENRERESEVYLVWVLEGKYNTRLTPSR